MSNKAEKPSETRAVMQQRETGTQDGEGSKGARTRRRILRATEQLLEAKPVWELRSADIARDAGIAPATFYSYFESVTDALLGLAEELPETTPKLIRMLQQPWTTSQDPRGFVEAYLEHWNMHRAAFGVRNVTADAGEPRFDEARFIGIEPMLTALAQRSAERQRRGALPAHLDSVAVAGTFIAMLARTAAIAPKVRRRGVTAKKMIDAAAHVAFLLFGETDDNSEIKTSTTAEKPVSRQRRKLAK